MKSGEWARWAAAGLGRRHLLGRRGFTLRPIGAGRPLYVGNGETCRPRSETVIIAKIGWHGEFQPLESKPTGLARLAIYLCLSLLGVGGALAAPTPQETAREIQQQQERLQQERERAQREQLERTVDVRLPQDKAAPSGRLPANESPCFPIRRIELDDASGAFLWAADAANTPDDPALGRCLGTAGINVVMTRIQNAIIARGYVTTRVLAAPQDLKTGTLQLKIIPGRIHAIRFTGDSGPRANAINAFPASPGDLLNLRDIEQALENFKRVPTAEADIQIAPAEALGESDVVIAWKQSFPFRVSISANDGGSRSTGKYLASTALSGDHLLTLNDLFYLMVNRDLGGGDAGDRGTRGYTLHYSLPWGDWLFAATASQSRYHQTTPTANNQLVYSGTSHTNELKATWMAHRNAVGKTSLSLRAYQTQSSNFIEGIEQKNQHRRMGGWEAGIQHKAFIADATLDLALNYRRGTGAFSALTAPEEFHKENISRPVVISADGAYNQPFKLADQSLRYNLSWRAQWNRTPLLPQDQFSIGGRYTVRGFDGELVLMAERGWLVRNDLGWALGNSGQELYLGIDHGEVGGPSAKLLIGERLTGGVIGLRGGYGGGNWDFFAGQPLSRPDGFKTKRIATGFNVGWSW